MGHNCAWRPFAVNGVDHDDGVVAILQVGDELNSGNTGFDHGDIWDLGPFEESVRDLDTERIVASQHVAYTGNKNVHDERAISAARIEYPWITHQAM